MKFYPFVLILIFTFLLNCQEEGKEEDKSYSADLIEVLGPKEKGVFDSLNVPDSLKNEVRNISNFNYYESGVRADDSPLAHNDGPFSEFLKLKNKAKLKELYQLTFNKNIPVSLYSSIAVSQRIPKLIPVFYSRILNTDEKVYSENGCLVGDLHPSEIFYNEYFSKFEENLASQDPMIKILDSISIFHKNTTRYVIIQALRHRIYPEHFQKQMEKLAFNNENPYVLLYLSNNFKNRYKDQLQNTMISYLSKPIKDEYQDYSKDALMVELMRYRNPKNKKIIENYSKNNYMINSNPEFITLKEANGIVK